MTKIIEKKQVHAGSQNIVAKKALKPLSTLSRCKIL